MTVGFDNKSVNNQLLVSLPFEEVTGTITHDVAKPHHLFTLTGVPTWSALASGLQVLDFDSGNPDLIQCLAADCADLDFTTSGYSIAMWINLDTLTSISLLNRDDISTGYNLALGHLGTLIMGTYQGIFAWQFTMSDSSPFSATTWYLVCATRDGATGELYRNGENITYTSGTHIDPVSAAALNVNIGVEHDGTGNPFDGRMWNPRIWGRALTASEIMTMFQSERDWFGV